MTLRFYEEINRCEQHRFFYAFDFFLSSGAYQRRSLDEVLLNEPIDRAL